MSAKPFKRFLPIRANRTNWCRLSRCGQAHKCHQKVVGADLAEGVFGTMIPDDVRTNIADAKVLVFDITRPNLNVYYEAGYAIGLGKAIAPVVNKSFHNALADIQRDGMFDNIGYRSYENSEELADILSALPETKLPISTAGNSIVSSRCSSSTLKEDDFRNWIVSAVKRSKVHYRSFDPVEVPRLSAVTVYPKFRLVGYHFAILGDHIEDATRHNLRAAFTAGISHGLGRQTLLVA